MSQDDLPLYAAHANEYGEKLPRRHLSDGRTGHVRPTEEEHRVLRYHEPEIDFVLRPDFKLSTGRQSRVSVLEYSTDGVHTKQLIWKRMGAGKGLTPTEARILQERLVPYRDDLVSAGWNVPRLYFSTVVDLPRESQIFSYEEFIPGGDGELLISDHAEPNFRKWFLTECVVSTLVGYGELPRETVAGRIVSCMPHGLDLKHANLVLSQQSDRLYFVDLFGPKELEDGEWLTRSEKLDAMPSQPLRAVCATREGAILRFWRLARRKWARSKSGRYELTDDFLDLLRRKGLPKEELRLIEDEILSGCPWMDSLYEERAI